jgi:hypothetical protein
VTAAKAFRTPVLRQRDSRITPSGVVILVNEGPGAETTGTTAGPDGLVHSPSGTSVSWSCGPSCDLRRNGRTISDPVFSCVLCAIAKIHFRHALGEVYWQRTFPNGARMGHVDRY